MTITRLVMFTELPFFLNCWALVVIFYFTTKQTDRAMAGVAGRGDRGSAVKEQGSGRDVLSLRSFDSQPRRLRSVSLRSFNHPAPRDSSQSSRAMLSAPSSLRYAFLASTLKPLALGEAEPPEAPRALSLQPIKAIKPIQLMEPI
jgi:hypothetical protein